MNPYKKTKSDLILGVSASSRRIHAVLVRDSAEGPVILRHFVHERGASDPFGAPASAPESFAGDDVALQFGDQASGGDAGLFLASEFGGGGEVGTATEEAIPGTYATAAKMAVPFDKELQAILKTCADAGYERPRIVFALATEHLGTVSFEADYELENEESGDQKKPRQPRKADLVKEARRLTKEPITADRAVFIPMRHENPGDNTHLAVYAQKSEPVTPTIKAIRDKKRRPPSFELIDTEVSLFYGLARALQLASQKSLDEEVALDDEIADADVAVDSVDESTAVDTAAPDADTDSDPAEIESIFDGFDDDDFELEIDDVPTAESSDDGSEAESEDDSALFEGSGLSAPAPVDHTTLVVRAGVEDTLVMFIEGDQLVHFENLRSVTTYDPPETICSRVLLLQDEFGAGDAEKIVLFGADNEQDLIEGFSDFFMESEVVSVRTILPPTEEERDEDEEPVGREGILASAAALRLVKDELFDSVFLDVDFLDRKLRGPRLRMPFSWPVAAMMAILFMTSLFFVYRFYDQHADITMQRYELQHYPQEMIENNTALLQAQIDSIQANTAGLIGALDVLDSLLVGSDAWSRTMEATSRHTSDIRGLWIESMYTNEGELHLEGTATNRNQVVAMASYSGGTIETIKFSEIREWPVYTFTMTMPFSPELPEAARYLREQARRQVQLESLKQSPTTAQAGASSANPTL